MARQLVLKEFVAAEVLPIRILDPLLNHRLVALVVGVLEIMQPDQQPRRHARTPNLFRIERAELAFEVAPVDLPCESEQGMLRIELLIESRLKQVVLTVASLTLSRFHRTFTTFLQGFDYFLAILQRGF